MVEYFEKEKLVRLFGDLSSENVSEIEQFLIDKLSTTDYLLIDVEDLKKIDPACIFMLYMVKVKAIKRGKEVSIRGSENSLYKEIIRANALHLLNS